MTWGQLLLATTASNHGRLFGAVTPMSQKLGRAQSHQLERDAKCGQPTTIRDYTGEVRHAGMTLSEYSNHMRSMRGDDLRPRNERNATVPCNGRTTCCYHERMARDTGASGLSQRRT